MTRRDPLMTAASHPGSSSVRWGGTFIGIGIGGLFDGIVLHQILQWHHLVSGIYAPTTLENLKINTLADGFFHAVTWVFTLLGLFLLWSGARGAHTPWRTSVLLGGLLLGWGLFNIVEGVVDHQILQIHHVRPGPHQLAYDLGFLGWGAVMAAVGWGLLHRRAA